MTGDRAAHLDLRTLKSRQHLYGIGPIEGLTGEVTIADSRPSLARIGAGAELHVTPQLSLAAKFDGEFASGSQTYAGTGTVRYVW